jgi:hypothetical protein
MGYLDDYGQGDPQRERIFKGIAILLVAAIVFGGVYYVFFRNWREERQARQFLTRLQESDFPGAYETWGCSVAEPCRYYPYEEFLKDWGPDGEIGKVESFRLGRSYEQQSGVIITLEVNGKPRPNLWVEKESKRVGFSPY